MTLVIVVPVGVGMPGPRIVRVSARRAGVLPLFCIRPMAPSHTRIYEHTSAITSLLAYTTPGFLQFCNRRAPDGELGNTVSLSQRLSLVR